ncbi:P-loop containing nucleoside triphosphate hydrolase protein [Roridomyces roridus]|uniref:DNA 3'-5' helicase n=1 Tax=Roridomyces roridus TaxID=1738132 RepID=A0AAD7BQ96_9AGAR|nr:P-loop containing nucleoside triphosphate hydrolase protein [Roridomyces roridus]
MLAGGRASRNDAVPTAYLATLDDRHATLALRACLLAFFANPKRIVPRQFQLEATLALADGRDVIVDCGTGSGKTLCQILPNLLFPTTSSLTISPLKRLQVVQVRDAAEFESWGIKTVCINEDTPNDSELWNRIRDGHFQHLIVQPEQLKVFQGHLPRLARLLDIPKFIKTITRVHVDEAHNHVLAGLPRFGLPPFRPAWGSLIDLRFRLPKGIPVQALSGTFPAHIKSTVIEHLHFHPSKFLDLKLSSNRSNTIYATHRIVGKLSDFRNLNFLVGSPHTYLRKAIVFHDNRQESAAAAAHVDQLLPRHLQKTGIVCHYHSGMSKDYLTKIFDDFSNPNGTCKIIHGTEGASTGLDVSDIDAVVDYGCTQNMSTALQRGGRCGRRGQESLYLVMVEPWVYTASLEAVDANCTDPDKPISGRLIKTSKKPERTGLAMVLYVRSEVCLREMIRRYLSDNSPQALDASTWCCDRHHPTDPSLDYDKSAFFPGKFLYLSDDGAVWAGDEEDAERAMLDPPKGEKRKRRRGPTNRPVDDRVELHHLLKTYLEKAHASDPLRAVRTRTSILSDTALVTLATAHPTRIRSIGDIVNMLEETTEWEEEWGSQVFNVISEYDVDFVPPVARTKRTKGKNKAKAMLSEDDDEDDDEVYDAPRQNPLLEVSSNVRRTARKGKASWKLRPQE